MEEFTNEMKEKLLKQWFDEGRHLLDKYGAIRKQVKCSNCGHILSISDFIEFRRMGICDTDKSGIMKYKSPIQNYVSPTSVAILVTESGFHCVMCDRSITEYQATKTGEKYGKGLCSLCTFEIYGEEMIW